MKARKQNRRNFIKALGLYTTGSLIATDKLFSNEMEFLSLNTKQDHVKEFIGNIKNSKATILETKLVSKEPGKFLIVNRQVDKNGHLVVTEPVLEPNRYLGWPSIAKTDNGELLIAYSGDRDSHVCPWGKTQLIRSTDNGKTWSEPETINNTPLDDRDAGIIQTQKGTILISWFTSLAYASPTWKWSYHKYARIAEKIPQELKDQWLGNWTIRSEDGGKTWLEPSKTVVTTPHGPIQLRDGRLLYVGLGYFEKKTSIVVEESSDDGVTWKVIGTIPPFKGSMKGLSELHTVELKNGKIISMVRNEPSNRDNCYLLQTESYDGGRTWTALHETPIWGYPPHLLELRNGWLVVVYGHRREPFSERACISKDYGKTWDIKNEITLSKTFNQDLGYPASVQMEDDSILTVYYEQEIQGEPTSIFTTHWKLK